MVELGDAEGEPVKEDDGVGVVEADSVEVPVRVAVPELVAETVTDPELVPLSEGVCVGE